MAVPLPQSLVAPPNIRNTVTPVLSALPGAAASTEPATTVLPALSPILRQRVQLLSSASTEPWIRLLTYDPSKVAKLTSVARSGDLDPHPVSGEVEVDWDHGINTRYKRLDQETLQSMVVLDDLQLFFRLVYCTGDPEGGGDGWRVGEVGTVDPSTVDAFGGSPDVNEAERVFEATKPKTSGLSVTSSTHATNSKSGWSAQATADDDEDDDDDYWARYDATPSRTPAVKRSPAPGATAQTAQADNQPSQSTEAEDAYFAQYDSVQPAMDNHDPDEEENLREHGEHVGPLPPVSLAKPEPANVNGTTNNGPTLAQPVPIKPESVHSAGSRNSQEESWVLAHPRPGSASSNASQTVARLEEAAESREQTEFGVKQHISRSIRSLFLLSRASGIDREEFERMVRTELDVLGMVENDI